MNSFSEVAAGSFSDQIVHQMEEAIMSGQLRMGDHLNTDELARQFKVSHIPVREALKKLEAQGLIVLEANKGARVLVLSKEDVRNIFEIRKVLEGLAASLAAKRINNSSRKRLQGLVNKMQQATKSKNFVALFTADKSFHQHIWGLTGNPFLIKALTNLLMPYFGYVATSGYYAHLDDLGYVPRVHQEILDALSTTESDRAQRAMVEVHNSTMKLLLG